jgi:hypothetical protein
MQRNSLILFRISISRVLARYGTILSRKQARPGERILASEASFEDEFALATETGASHQTKTRYSRNI